MKLIYRFVLFLTAASLICSCSVSKTQTVNSPNTGITLDEKKETPDKVIMTITPQELQRMKESSSRLDYVVIDLTYQFCYLLGIRSDQGRLPQQPTWNKVIEKFRTDLRTILEKYPNPGSNITATFICHQTTIRHYILSNTANLLTMNPTEALDVQLDVALQGLNNWCKIETY